jgi:hypothetical protein
MKPSEIRVGVTYVNRGAGRTQRTVLAIGDGYRPRQWLSSSRPPDEPGVFFEQKGKQDNLYLSSFASWAKRSVVCDHLWHQNPALITDCPECGASG